VRRLGPTLALVAVVAACGGQPTAEAPTPRATTSAPATPSPSTPTAAPTSAPSTEEPPAAGTAPPSWLGTRPLPKTPEGFGVQRPTPAELRDRRFTLADRIPALPGTGFAFRIVDPAPADVIARSTWAPGCPVKAGDLAWVRLTFRGFEGARHSGELLVNSTVARPLVEVFHRLYDAGFPIEEMRITTKAEQSAPPTGDGNDTGAFNCRAVRGATTYSQHAYGLAVDVNPFQNPYLKGDLVLPELAGAYRNRDRHRPGMILPAGPVVRAFARIGWGWGGSWHSLRDLQHFSANGR
jgi:hypothetical protein